MLTPYFEISQTEDEIILKIKAPLANIKQTELSVDEDTVIFYSSPYYLRIHLPGKVREDESSCGQYDSSAGQFTFKLIKINKGEHFSDLDMIGRLLEPRKKVEVKPSIELVENNSTSDCDSNIEDEDEWFFSQKLVKDETLLIDDCLKYGFANKSSGFMNDLRAEFFEILDVVGAEQKSEEERNFVKENEETTKFSNDHYLADLMEPDEIEGLLKYVPPWESNLQQSDKVVLTPAEKESLKNLGNREYLLDSKERRIILCSLVDILFAYCYNHRCTLGENTVESAWTINKISSTLSWFQTFYNIKDVKRSCVRRALIFPLYRHWQLCMTVLNDTLNILKLGRRQVLKCMLEIHSLFNLSEPRYLLNQLYITDYCIWLQKCPDKRLSKLAQVFENETICKNDIGLDLEELEVAAKLVHDEQTDKELQQLLDKVEIASSESEIDESGTCSDSDSNVLTVSSSDSSGNSGAESDVDSDDLSHEE